MKYIIILTTIILIYMTPLGFAYENHIYIWQRSWDSYLEDAINVIQDYTRYFTVLCGDIKVEGKKTIINLVDINWTYLNQTETSAVLAFRINTQASELFETDAVYRIADSIKESISKTIKSAPPYEIVGVQFDYDCPTSKLKGYTRFLRIMKERLGPLEAKLPEFNISITALPTWLESNDFKELAQLTAYYVLQLHSFELPKDANQVSAIFPNDKAYLYIKEASKLKHPYYVSLPTYGYEVAYNKGGKFLGFRAETNPGSWGKDVSYATEMANPNEILIFTKYLGRANPEYFLGIYWFRLPLKSDEFNWDIKTLGAILEGKSPVVAFKIDKTLSSDGLYEVYLSNAGESNITDNVSFNMEWHDVSPPIYDILKQYNAKVTNGGNGLYIEGPAPKVGEKVLIGWFRTMDKTKDLNLAISEVTVNEND